MDKLKHLRFYSNLAPELRSTRMALNSHPELWNEYSERLNSPIHAQVDDIWLRFNARENFDPLAIHKFLGPHFPVWYPAVEKLPEVKSICSHLMYGEAATMLGGVLITRIPAGGAVLPHVDKGWHPEFYNRKLYCVLKSNDQCINRVEDETAVMKEGEVWFFDNTKEHEVINNGTTERITLIVCMRVED